MRTRLFAIVIVLVGGAAAPWNSVLASVTCPNVISRGKGNTAPGTYECATVSGGYSNDALADYATVGGGWDNTASGTLATVSGGYTNTASGTLATVSGGVNNTASSQWATVSGGENNTASSYYATVGGGQSNRASASYSTVPGGFANDATGDHSFAAGRQAKAVHPGTFVWGDSTAATVSSTAANQFIARASGGVTFYSNGAATSGVSLAPGANSWSTLSDRNAKANITAIDSASILERLASIPIQLWNYKTQDATIKHIGPMAQDFRAAFGVGENDTTISTVDADGVALAAIQGLYQENQAKDQQIAALRAEAAAVQERLVALEQAQQGESSAAQATATGVTLNWGSLALGLGLLIVLLIVSSISLTLLFLRRRTLPA